MPAKHIGWEQEVHQPAKVVAQQFASYFHGPPSLTWVT